MNVPEKPTCRTQAVVMPRAIEVGFSIVEMNRLAEPGRNSFAPIYQMHKWFGNQPSAVYP